MKNLLTITLVFGIFSSLYGQDASTLNSRGFRQAKKGNYTAAIALFSQAIGANSFYTDAYYNRALAYSKLKDY
jgi:tetratricopeptide (TPR) repeat protein